MTEKELMTDNLRFMVGAGGGGNIVITRLGLVLTHEEALNLAGWLVALADPSNEEFPKYLEIIRGT